MFLAALQPAADDRTWEMDVTESEKILERVQRGSEQILSFEEVRAKYQDDKPRRKAAKARKGKR